MNNKNKLHFIKASLIAELHIILNGIHAYKYLKFLIINTYLELEGKKKIQVYFYYARNVLYTDLIEIFENLLII